jgi:DNA-binding NtrC family response regulator
MEAFERLYLLQQLRRFRGRITDVARHCGGRRSTFAS